MRHLCANTYRRAYRRVKRLASSGRKAANSYDPMLGVFLVRRGDKPTMAHGLRTATPSLSVKILCGACYDLAKAFNLRGESLDQVFH